MVYQKLTFSGHYLSKTNYVAVDLGVLMKISNDEAS